MVIDLRGFHRKLVMVFLFCCIPFFFHHGVKQIQEKREEKQVITGEFLSWTEVNELFPRYAKATVIDIDTGLSFRLQRRAGGNHADVQPLTAEDTAVMKQIYNGKWSWKRRAVLVEVEDGRRIAASMNGMPHGQGAIQGNEFNGHFCIHFRDSKTHGSGRVDEAHQLMVWKAAGVIEDQMKDKTARQVMNFFFLALNQGDRSIPEKLLLHPSQDVLESLASIGQVYISNIKPLEKDSYQVRVKVYYKNSHTVTTKSSIIHMVKKGGCYRIDETTLQFLVPGS